MIELEGQIVKKLHSVGSKNEHLATTIQTSKEEYLLRRVGGNAFNDEILNSLVGHKIIAKGVVRSNTFFMNEWKKV